VEGQRDAIRHTGPIDQAERLAADIERSYLTGVKPETGGARALNGTRRLQRTLK